MLEPLLTKSRYKTRNAHRAAGDRHHVRYHTRPDLHASVRPYRHMHGGLATRGARDPSLSGRHACRYMLRSLRAHDRCLRAPCDVPCEQPKSRIVARQGARRRQRMRCAAKRRCAWRVGRDRGRRARYDAREHLSPEDRRRHRCTRQNLRILAHLRARCRQRKRCAADALMRGLPAGTAYGGGAGGGAGGESLTRARRTVSSASQHTRRAQRIHD